MRRSMKAVAGICVLVGTLLLASGTASAQDCGAYGPVCEPAETLTFEYPRTVRAGGTVHITGQIADQDPQVLQATGETVAFVLADEAIGTTPIEDDGTFAGDFTVPHVAPGEYRITATSGTLSAAGPITVIAEGTTGNGTTGNGTTVAGRTDPLARTGFDATPMVTLGAAVLILGGAAVYGSKRRRIA